MIPFYAGTVIRIAFAARFRQNDHVDVRLPSGAVVSTYRFLVHEIQAQRCPEPTRRTRQEPSSQAEA